jgi:uncharacterized membrane protein
MDRTLLGLLCAAAIGSGIVGGIFYGFSSFVMKALGRIAPEQGIAAMNSINVMVINPSFMLPFVGTALLCALLATGSYIWWPHVSGRLVLLAALLYLVGSFGLTMVIHQPMNLKLAGLPTAQALDYWAQYLDAWTLWNHVRAAASLLSATLFVAVLVLSHLRLLRC